MGNSLILSVLVLISLGWQIHGFYLPGLAPVNYCKEPSTNQQGSVKCEVNII